MAIKKRSKGGRVAGGAKTTVRAGAAARAKTTSKKKKKLTTRAATAVKSMEKARPKPKPMAKAKTAPKRSASPKASVSKPVHDAGAENPELVRAKARFQRERSGLEKRLTEAVREIGLLRHHELRAMQFERQLTERDATIARLQTRLAELERQPVEPIYEEGVQQMLALRAPAEAVAADPDEFEDEDDHLGDDAGLATEDD